MVATQLLIGRTASSDFNDFNPTKHKFIHSSILFTVTTQNNYILYMDVHHKSWSENMLVGHHPKVCLVIGLSVCLTNPATEERIFQNYHIPKQQIMKP